MAILTRNISMKRDLVEKEDPENENGDVEVGVNSVKAAGDWY